MIEVKAPASIFPAINEWFSVFLAGSIEMGAAEPWQARVAAALADFDVLVLNPRRDDWDSSWRQSKDDARFREQVEWELLAQERCSMIAMRFDPATKSPITLLELGLAAGSRPRKIVVCCPDGYWRKGNVDLVCERCGVKQVEEIEELVEEVRSRASRSI